MDDALATVWPDQGRIFVTFEDPEDDSSFLQFVDGQLNLAWPFDDDPRTRLPRVGVPLPPGVRVLSWTRHGTAVLHNGDLRCDETAAWIDLLLERVLDIWDPEVRTDSDR